MYKILFIESGDYLYYRIENNDIEHTLVYSIYEIDKCKNRAYFQPITDTKRNLMKILEFPHTVHASDNSIIRIDKNKTLFEIIEEN